MVKRDRWESSSEDEDTKTGRKPAAKISVKKGCSSDSTELRARTSVPAVASPAAIPDLPLHSPLLHGCRSVYETYEQISRLSEGTYGIVWKARDLAAATATSGNDSIVALKQIKFEDSLTKEGFPVSALREISVLLALSHENIVSVKEMVMGDASNQVFMVMEFFECDLKDGIRRFDGALLQGELKDILRQILLGLDHMHNKWYLHRDLKTSNILVHHSGRIALADFGLARRYQNPAKAMTVPVVTLWYRAPELLLGETRYGPAIDMWSVGCIFGELIRKDAVLPGEGELDQIDRIFALLGVPDETNWPGFQSLPSSGVFRWKPRSSDQRQISHMFPVAKPVSTNQAFLDITGYDLLEQLLRLDPKKRISARDALQHSYFSTGVEPRVPRFFSGG